jgi:acylphosphatase
MKRRIIITGPRVHDVGYRPFLLEYALVNGFTHFFAINVLSDGKQQVVITLDEKEEAISSFITYISSKRPDFAEVSDIRSEEFEGEVAQTGIYLQDLQFEQLCKGIPAILRIEKSQQEMISLQKVMLDKQDQMLDKQDKMLDKQDQMLDKQDKMLEQQDKMLEKQDEMLYTQGRMLEKQDHMIHLQQDTVDEIKGLRKDSANYLDREFTEIKKKLTAIENTLTREGIQV